MLVVVVGRNMIPGTPTTTTTSHKLILPSHKLLPTTYYLSQAHVEKLHIMHTGMFNMPLKKHKNGPAPNLDVYSLIQLRH